MFGWERKKEALNEFFQKELSAGQRMRIAAACVDMWEPYRLSIEQWAPNCRIVYDKFHVMHTPTKPLTKCGGPSSSARGAECAVW
jgi:transposase